MKRKFKTVKYIDEGDKQFSINDLKEAINNNKTLEDLIIIYYVENGDYK